MLYVVSDTFAHGDAAFALQNGTVASSFAAHDSHGDTLKLLSELTAEVDIQDMALGPLKIIAE